MDELKEKIARAIKARSGIHSITLCEDWASAVLRAIEEAGYDIVPQTDEGGHIIHRPMVSSDEGYDPMTPDEIAAAKEKLLNLEEPRG